MIELYKDNWTTFNYINGTHRKSNVSDQIKINYKHYIGPIDTFKNELLNAVKSIRDKFNNIELSLLLSGGSESEMVLLAFKHAGINVLPYIFRFENDYNIYDVSHAVIACENLQIPYKIIDFNIKHFYENDAETISELAQLDRPRTLPQLQMCNLVNGIPIMGGGDPHWFRHSKDYTIKGIWKFQEFEHELGWDKYFIETNRQGIPHILKWSPQLMISYTKLQWFNDLINDGYPGKLSNWSTKMIGYREQWPELNTRIKKTGFENIDDLIMEYDAFLYKKYNGYIFRGSYILTMEQFIENIGC